MCWPARGTSSCCQREESHSLSLLPAPVRPSVRASFANSESAQERASDRRCGLATHHSSGFQRRGQTPGRTRAFHPHSLAPRSSIMMMTRCPFLLALYFHPPHQPVLFASLCPFLLVLVLDSLFPHELFTLCHPKNVLVSLHPRVIQQRPGLVMCLSLTIVARIFAMHACRTDQGTSEQGAYVE
jgi:hypothetical protein